MVTNAIDLNTNITSKFYENPYLPIVAEECKANSFFQNLTNTLVNKVRRVICELIFSPIKNDLLFQPLVGQETYLVPAIIKEEKPIYIGDVNVLDLIVSLKLKSTGTTALLYSIQKIYCHNTEFLIRANANTNEPNNNGETALMLAVKRGYSNSFDILVEASDINRADFKGNTALMIAAELNNDSMIYKLLNANSIIDLKNHNGKTALMITTELHPRAAPIKQLNSVLALLNHGKANPNLQDHESKTALMLLASAIKHNRNEDVEIAKELLKAGADPNLQDHKGKTVLMLLAGGTKHNRNDDHEIAKELLKAGADPYLKDENGHTAFELAIKNQHSEIINLLTDLELTRQQARSKLIEEAKKKLSQKEL